MRANPWNENWLASKSKSEQREILDDLTDEEWDEYQHDWRNFVRREQLPPKKPWQTWLLMGGRGSGKTRAGAEWIIHGIRTRQMKNIALLGATYHDTRAVMIEGESGILACDQTAKFEPSNHRIVWPGGAIATVLTAEEPDGIRGHNFDAAWGDEFCKWPYPQEALDMLQLALRTGTNPRLLLTTTPRNIRPLKALIETTGTKLIKMKTTDNANNLAPGFIAAMEARYGGTALGRQEMDADLIEDNDAAPWRRDWIEATRVREAPVCSRVAIGLDPSASVTGDECGIVVAGLAEQGGGVFILADRSAGGLTPTGWALRVADVYDAYKADIVIAEANYGGDMVRTVLQQNAPHLAVHLVNATRDKRTRALPAAALYEQGKVHHVGTFPDLEDQMCTYDDRGPSPDRMDALVHVLTYLKLGPQSEPKIHTL
ncbi:MAG TPA: terminase family protein [Rhizomicrobium sp.]|nr:terminase family protein [Rhizomicrobium sp.]